MRKLIAALAAVIVSSACGSLLDPAAAVVYGEKITFEEVEKALDDFARTPEFGRLAQQGDADALKRQFEQGYLSQLIRRAVLTPPAETFDITVSDADVEEQLTIIKEDFPSEQAFDEALAEQGLTLAQLKVLIRDREIESRLRTAVTEDVDPAEEQLRTYYENHLNTYSRTRAQHILVDDASLAADIADQLHAAPRNEVDDLFAELAEKHSKDESNAGKAGDLGFFSAGQFVQEFEEAVAELAVGEISDPVETEFGFHVIRVNTRKVETFDEARAEIEQLVDDSLEEAAWSEWLAGVYEDADVKVNPRYGVFDAESQQVVDAGASDIPGGYETTRPDPLGSPTPSP